MMFQPIRFSRFSGSLLVSTAFVFAAGPATALTITTADGVGADSYIFWTTDGSERDTNYGAESVVAVKDPFNPPNGFNTSRKTYLRFDLGPLGNQQVNSAQLELTFAGGTPAEMAFFSLYGLLDGDAGESWGESTITWNTAPANDFCTSCVDLSRATLLAEGSLPATVLVGDLLAFSTPELISFLNADSDGQITLILVGNVPGDNIFSAFWSKEGAGPGPTLQVFGSAAIPALPRGTYGVAALLLIVASSLALARARRAA